MYDELVKRIREQVKCNKKIYPQGAPFETLLLDLAADAIEALSKIALDEHNRAAKLTWERRWIPVTERLPKADEEVLIYLWDNPSAYIAWVDQEGRWETNDFYVDKDYLPKAWMPLPPPPEEELA